MTGKGCMTEIIEGLRCEIAPFGEHGLWKLDSPDMRTLVLHGKTPEGLRQSAPIVIRELRLAEVAGSLDPLLLAAKLEEMVEKPSWRRFMMGKDAAALCAIALRTYAQGIEAHSDETPEEAVQPEGREPGLRRMRPNDTDHP
jgi:hypothetical protein